jgi:hypothetical protein
VVALLYPHKSLPATGYGALPDVWDGFDDYRDSLLVYLGQVKFGKGLRFFLDPLARRIGMAGETDYLVPDATHFLIEWEGWLASRYPTTEDVKLAWGIMEGDFPSHRDLARLIPLWANERGIPYLHDPQMNRDVRILDVRQSKWWQDFLQCRNDSIAYYMNTLADVLKHQVADVPVVYTWTQTHPIFWNMTRTGFDGLGVAVRQRGSSGLVARVLGPAYSEAEQSARRIWCVATEVVGDAAPPPARAAAAGETASVATLPPDGSAPAPPAAGVGYGNRAELLTALDQLRRVGYKGFFAGGFQVNPNEEGSGAEWLRTPESLDWLHEFGTRLEGEANVAASYAPHVLFFPQYAPGPARIGLVPGANDVLWLNSFASGEALDWWPSYSGYVIQIAEDGTRDIVLLSLQGKRLTHFMVPDAKQVQAFTPEGTPVPLKILSKNSFQVTLDSTPVIFKAGAQRIFPQEASEDVMLQLGALMQIATEQKVTEVDQEHPALDRARLAYKQRDFETAYIFSRAALDDLIGYASPYIWIEGERPYLNTFGETAANAEASGGGYLRLSTPNAPARFGYAARYLFDVPTDGRYAVWVAGTVPGPSTSPIKWRLNSDPEQDPVNTVPQQPFYLGERFGWTLLGTVSLKKGPQQALTIYVTGRAASPPDYIFSIDALLLTPRAFAPNGPVRPLPVDAETLRAYEKSMKSHDAP